MSLNVEDVKVIRLEVERIPFGAEALMMSATVQVYGPKIGGLPLPIGGPVSTRDKWWSKKTSEKLSEFFKSAENDLKLKMGITEKDEVKPKDGPTMPSDTVLGGLGNIPPAE